VIDAKKTYRTRGGSPVRIYAIDGRGNVPVHGAYERNDGWQVGEWAADGKSLPGSTMLHALDLIEVKPRIKRMMWVNIYNDEESFGHMHASKAAADKSAIVHRLACIPITIDCAEGEGLEEKS
jgi:hypothetical protein